MIAFRKELRRGPEETGRLSHRLPYLSYLEVTLATDKGYFSYLSLSLVRVRSPKLIKTDWCELLSISFYFIFVKLFIFLLRFFPMLLDVLSILSACDGIFAVFPQPKSYSYISVGKYRSVLLMRESDSVEWSITGNWSMGFPFKKFFSNFHVDLVADNIR